MIRLLCSFGFAVTASLAMAQDDQLPGLSLTDARILSQDGDSYSVRANEDIRQREIEAAMTQLCGAPATVTRGVTNGGTHPPQVTYRVRCTR